MQFLEPEVEGEAGDAAADYGDVHFFFFFSCSCRFGVKCSKSENV